MGPISTLVDLEAAAPEKKSALNRVCPAHHVKLSQSYKCPGTGNEPEHDVPWNTWKMGVPTDDGYRIVNTETKPKNEKSTGLKLIPVPREQLENATFEGKGAYYALPSNEHMYETWGIFAKVVQGDVALIARGALRAGAGTDKLWRVTTFNGYLVLREILFPDNLKPAPIERGTEADDEMLELVSQFVDKLRTDWSDFDSSDNMAARLES